MVIDMISKHLHYHADQQQKRNLVLRCALIVVAAHNINGTTLHRLLSLPLKKKLQDLNEEQLTRLQDSFRDRWLLIIDEKSIIEAQTLHYIDRQLRQIRCCPDVFFGGINILFRGDFG